MSGPVDHSDEPPLSTKPSSDPEAERDPMSAYFSTATTTPQTSGQMFNADAHEELKKSEEKILPNWKINNEPWPQSGYRIVRMLAEGGRQGSIWEAKQTSLKRTVVLKHVPKVHAMYVRNAQLDYARTNTHPHLITIIDMISLEDGALVIVMPKASGSLKERIQDWKGRDNPPKQLLQFMKQVADGIDYIHASGYLHRDIKPDNLLETDGGVQVADIDSLAPMTGGTAYGPAGTAGYRPPEAEVPPYSWHKQSDVYSLAMTYLALRTGAPNLDTMSSITNPAERAVLDKALTPTLEDRQSSCVEFVNDMERAVAVSAAMLRPYAMRLRDEVSTFQLPCQSPRTITELLTLRLSARTQDHSDLQGYTPASPTKSVVLSTREALRHDDDSPENRTEEQHFFTLNDAIVEHPHLWILGPSGSGKSAQLDAIAFALCNKWLELDSQFATNWCLPLRVDLRLCSGDLLTHCAVLVQNRLEGLDSVPKNTEELKGSLRRWLWEGRLILLVDHLDDLDEVRRRIALAQLAELTTGLPDTQFILVSQEARTHELPNVPRFDLSPFTTNQVLRVFTELHGKEEGRRAFLALREAGMIDAFTLPIRTWLLALSYTPGASAERICPGMLYQHILEVGLREWFTRRNGDAQSAVQAVEFLANLAHEMDSAGQGHLGPGMCSEVFDRVSFRTLDPNAHSVLGSLVAAGILKQSRAGVTFRHSIYQSYFNAVHLRDNCNPYDACLLSSDAKAKNILRFYVGIASEDDARSFLVQLTRSVRRRRWLLRLTSNRSVTTRLLLLLWCLADAKHSHNTIKDHVILSLQGNRIWNILLYRWFGTGAATQLYLSEDSPSLWSYHRILCPIVRLYTVFLCLIARFGTTAAEAFVTARMYEDERWWFIDRPAIHMQRGFDYALDRVFADYAALVPRPTKPLKSDVSGISKDKLRTLRRYPYETNAAQGQIPYLLFASDPTIAIPKVRKFLSEAPATAVEHFWGDLRTGLQNLDTEQILSDRHEDRAMWLAFLCDQYLHHENSWYVLDILRRFDGGHAVPQEATPYLVAGLKEGDSEVQYRARGALIYSCGSDVFVPALRQIVLESEDLNRRLMAMIVLRKFDLEMWPEDMTVLIESLQTSDMQQFIEGDTAFLVDSGDKSTEGRERSVATLVAGYNFIRRIISPESVANKVREWCIRGLGQIHSPMIRRFLKESVVDDRQAGGDVRSAALFWLFQMTEDWEEKSSVLAANLSDPDAEVRERCMRIIDLAPVDIITRFLPELIVIASANDGQASKYASYAVQRIAGIAWQPGQPIAREDRHGVMEKAPLP